MKKEMYDASIHFGQFSLNNDIRIRCKNAQVRITGKEWIVNKSINEVIWVVTFVENTESDHLIWETLSRKEQDVFYPWMDVYHTVKDIEKVRDSDPKIKRISIKIENDYWCSWASANIIAWAISTWCSIIFTLYSNLLEKELVTWIMENFWIHISKPPIWKELVYTWGQIQEEDWKVFDLEHLYQNAIQLYTDRDLDLLQNLFHLQKKENRL